MKNERVKRYNHVYKSEDGRFSYFIELGVDRITGKRIQRRRFKDENGKKFETAKEAYLAVCKVEREYHEKQGVNNYNITFDSYLNNIYLPYYKSLVKTQTYDTRIRGLEVIGKRFKGKKLRDLTVRDAEAFRIFLINESGYSQGYASQVYGAFRQSLDYAVTMDFLSENVSKKTSAISKGETDVAFWNKEEFEKVISTYHVEDYNDHLQFIMIWLYYMTGIRVSEGLGLTWDDVNLNKKTLRISHSLLMKNQEDYDLYGDTKTDNSRRVIALDDDTVKYLREWENVQEEHGAMKIVMSLNDKPLHRSNVLRNIRRHAKLAGVHEVQGKGLRHSHVSFLINELNASVLIVAQRLGNTPEIVLKHYAHLFSRRDELVAEQMTGLIKVTFSKEKLTRFNGNQHVKM